MMFTVEVDREICPREIEEFIDEHDKEGYFSTKDRWHLNFCRHFQRIINAGQVISFYDDEGLAGFCSWVICDKGSKQEINKTKWELPFDISKGDILYVDVCLLVRGASIFKIRKILTDKCRRLGIKKVFWYDIPHRKVFSSQLKGGDLCLAAAV